MLKRLMGLTMAAYTGVRSGSDPGPRRGNRRGSEGNAATEQSEQLPGRHYLQGHHYLQQCRNGHLYFYPQRWRHRHHYQNPGVQKSGHTAGQYHLDHGRLVTAVLQRVASHQGPHAGPAHFRPGPPLNYTAIPPRTAPFRPTAIRIGTLIRPTNSSSARTWPLLPPLPTTPRTAGANDICMWG